MIVISLYDYLTAPGNLSGQSDTESFASPIVMGRLTIANRNDARRYLRDRIGQRIYAGRRLVNEGFAAVTLRQISGAPEYHLQGDERTTDVVQVDTFAKGEGSFLQCSLISELIRIAVSSYRGNWGRGTVSSIVNCQMVRGGLQETAPKDASAYWTHRISTDYQIIYFRNLVEV